MSEQLYKAVELREGNYVQYVAVHPLAWRPEWGKPEIGFIEVDYDELADELEKEE